MHGLVVCHPHEFCGGALCMMGFVIELEIGYRSGITRFFSGCLLCFLLVRILYGSWCVLLANRYECEYEEQRLMMYSQPSRGGGDFQKWREGWGRSPFGGPLPPEKGSRPRSPFAQ